MSNDPVQSWLNAAGRFPLLPKTEIIRLAKKRDTLQPGSKAYIRVVNKLTNHNLRLIPTVVRKYVAKRTGINMSSDVTSDLLQQGYLGLRRAAEKFDATRGFTFATYAHSWIYQAFSRWHNSHDRAIYIPENAMTEVLYRKRHGHPSKSKNGRIGDEVLAAALRAQYVTSVDVRINDEEADRNTLADLMTDNNRVLSNKSLPESKAEVELRDLMTRCGIRAKTQDIVSAYTKRGNMMIVAARLGMSQKHCQNLYSEAVREMKSKVAEMEADRLKSINTTSTRN